MPNLGCHLSPSAGMRAMGETALSLGGDTLQFFTRNPRGGKARVPDAADCAALSALQTEGKLGKIIAHAAYTVNPCGADPRVREFALEAMSDDLRRMELLPGNLYNFHPGSHVGQGEEAGIAMIADALNQVLFPEMNTIVLLETMAGKGSEIGKSFEQLRSIIDRIQLKEKVGVCFDTCHTWDAGYDLAGDLDGVLNEFDRIIGLDHLKAVHLNDSKNNRGSHKDRHEKLGQGCLGEETIRNIIRHPALQGRPFILETPNDEDGYIREIRIVQAWQK